MSYPHVSDGDDPLFDFDFLDHGATSLQLGSPPTSFGTPGSLIDNERLLSTEPHGFTARATATPVEYGALSSSSMVSQPDFDRYKDSQHLLCIGETGSQPMDIVPRSTTPMTITVDGHIPGTTHLPVDQSAFAPPDDLSAFGVSQSTTSSFASSSYTTSFAASSAASSYTTPSSDSEPSFSSGKGKGKSQDFPPRLPPLRFTPSPFARGETDWPEIDFSHPGPSTHHHSFSVPCHPSSAPPSPPNHILQASEVSYSSLSRPRSRSLSSLSSRSMPRSTKSAAGQSFTTLRINLKPGQANKPGNLARKLFSRKSDEKSRSLGSDSPISPESVSNITDALLKPELLTTVNCPQDDSPCDIHLDISPAYILRLPNFDSDIILSDAILSADSQLYTLPLPLSDASQASKEVKPPPDFFDDLLPKEIRIDILKSLIDLHIAAYETFIQSEEWTAAKSRSSESRWMGKNRAIRELVKFSRVSRTWQGLVFDGQIWVHLNLRGFPKMRSFDLLRFARAAGRFAQTMDLCGHSKLTSATVVEMTQHLLQTSGSSLTSYSSHQQTRLTHINLSGCQGVSSHALNDLLKHSPALLELRLRGVTGANDSTCDILSIACPNLITLDLGRCRNVTADGIRSILYVAEYLPSKSLPLKELRLSGLRGVDDQFMALLGKALPFLEILDLSYVRGLHNSALDAFTNAADDHDYPNVISLTAREVGRDPNEGTRFRRRVTRLRHLSLSSCSLLTDHACSHLAHAVPQLELLELASIGPELRDPGLIRLLSTTPLLRRLDLEEATDITDLIIEALIPIPLANPSSSSPPLSPSHSTAPSETGLNDSPLEQLNLSYAANISNDALLKLMRSCSRLRSLELDSTRVFGASIREFVNICHKRSIRGGEVVAVDCRSVGENVIKDLSPSTRTRKGWRSHEARKLGYLDFRDKENLGVGQDECDESKVVVKSFYSWQTVDAVSEARKQKKAASKTSTNREASSGMDEEDYVSSSQRSSGRWWNTSLRRSGSNTPSTVSNNADRDCVIM